MEFMIEIAMEKDNLKLCSNEIGSKKVKSTGCSGKRLLYWNHKVSFNRKYLHM
jgi:hypothetical protein